MHPLKYRLASIAVGLALLGAQPALAAGAEPVTLAVPALSFSFTMEFVAQDLGLFAKEGLAVKEVDIAGLGAINSLISGSSDFALASGASLTRAAAHGQRLLDIAALSDRSFGQIVLRKTLAEQAGFDPHAPLAKRAQVLKGRTIGVDSINALNDVYLRLVARAGGIDPDSMRIAVIAPPSLPAAFASKQIDGFSMTPPWPQQPLLDGTAVLVASGPDGDPSNLVPLINSVLLTRHDVCEKRPSICEKMGHAYAAAAEVIRDHPDQAIAVLEKRFPTLNAKTVEAAFAVLRKITPVPPAPTLDGIRNNETFNVMAGLLKPDQALKSFDDLFTDKYVR
ncbi:MAG TPA: ABC transporter substrate-binding protein [Stellaceae bacterium]|nr:ABC transporter substrate-binding protein [Stellaceae bacterium]